MLQILRFTNWVQVGLDAVSSDDWPAVLPGPSIVIVAVITAYLVYRVGRASWKKWGDALALADNVRNTENVNVSRPKLTGADGSNDEAPLSKAQHRINNTTSPYCCSFVRTANYDDSSDSTSDEAEYVDDISTEDDSKVPPDGTTDRDGASYGVPSSNDVTRNDVTDPSQGEALVDRFVDELTQVYTPTGCRAWFETEAGETSQTLTCENQVSDDDDADASNTCDSDTQLTGSINMNQATNTDNIVNNKIAHQNVPVNKDTNSPTKSKDRKTQGANRRPDKAPRNTVYAYLDKMNLQDSNNMHFSNLAVLSSKLIRDIHWMKTKKRHQERCALKSAKLHNTSEMRPQISAALNVVLRAFSDADENTSPAMTVLVEDAASQPHDCDQTDFQSDLDNAIEDIVSEVECSLNVQASPRADTPPSDDSDCSESSTPINGAQTGEANIEEASDAPSEHDVAGVTAMETEDEPDNRSEVCDDADREDIPRACDEAPNDDRSDEQADVSDADTGEDKRVEDPKRGDSVSSVEEPIAGIQEEEDFSDNEVNGQEADDVAAKDETACCGDRDNVEDMIKTIEAFVETCGVQTQTEFQEKVIQDLAEVSHEDELNDDEGEDTSSSLEERSGGDEEIVAEAIVAINESLPDNLRGDVIAEELARGESNERDDLFAGESNDHGYLVDESNDHDYLADESNAHDYLADESNAHDYLVDESNAHDYLVDESSERDRTDDSQNVETAGEPGKEGETVEDDASFDSQQFDTDEAGSEQEESSYTPVVMANEPLLGEQAGCVTAGQYAIPNPVLQLSNYISMWPLADRGEHNENTSNGESCDGDAGQNGEREQSCDKSVTCVESSRQRRHEIGDELQSIRRRNMRLMTMIRGRYFRNRKADAGDQRTRRVAHRLAGVQPTADSVALAGALRQLLASRAFSRADAESPLPRTVSDVHEVVTMLEAYMSPVDRLGVVISSTSSATAAVTSKPPWRTPGLVAADDKGARRTAPPRTGRSPDGSRAPLPTCFADCIARSLQKTLRRFGCADDGVDQTASWRRTMQDRPAHVADYFMRVIQLHHARCQQDCTAHAT